MALFRTLAAAAVATAISGMAPAETMGVGAGPDAQLTYNLGYVIAGVTSQSAGLGMTVQQYDGSQNLALTSSGGIAFSLSNIQELRAAIGGTEQFEGSALPNLRAVARLIDMRVGLFVPFDSEVKSIADLAGKRVPVGYGSQATERVAMIALLAAGGLTPADVEQVEVQDTGEAMVAFREDRLDVMMGTVLIKRS
jgi:TRAP transporter TAXI family solute receptor